MTKADDATKPSRGRSATGSSAIAKAVTAGFEMLGQDAMHLMRRVEDSLTSRKLVRDFFARRASALRARDVEKKLIGGDVHFS
jgi:hypothetical protein